MSEYLNTTIATLSGHTGAVRSLKLLPDGRLASCSDDFTVRIWNLTTGNVSMTLYGHTAIVYAVEVLANGYLLSGGSAVGNDYPIRVWNTTTGSLVRNITYPHSGYIKAIKTLNNFYFASGGDNTVKVLLRSNKLRINRNPRL